MADAGENYEELIPADTPADVEMGGDVPVVEIEAEEGDGMPFQGESGEETTVRTTYIDYLKSPVIHLLVGQGDEQALLTAHQALITRSPWFADACAKFSDDVSVSIGINCVALMQLTNELGAPN